MPENEYFQDLSPDEKLALFYSKSVAMLQKLTADGWKMLALVDALDFPFHVFDECRKIVEETSKLLHSIMALLGEEEPTDRVLRDFKNSSAEWQLSNIRLDLTTKLWVWKYNGNWMEHWLAERGAFNLPPEMNDWCQYVVHFAEEIQSLLAPNFSKSRDQSEQEARTIQRETRLRAQFPLLSQYESYSEALKETALRLSLSLFEQAELEDSSPWYVMFSSPTRRAITRLHSSSFKDPFGEYIIVLQWRTNDKYQTWREYRSSTHSIDEVVQVLHYWLVAYWDLGQLQQNFLWLSQAIIDSGFHPTWLPKNLRYKGGYLSPLLSIQNVYETDTNPKSRLVLEAFQGINDEKKASAQTESQIVSIRGRQAVFSVWRGEPTNPEDQSENGTLVWSENGITYNIYYSNMKFDVSDMIRIAESMRWTVVFPLPE